MASGGGRLLVSWWGVPWQQSCSMLSNAPTSLHPCRFCNQAFRPLIAGLQRGLDSGQLVVPEGLPLLL